MMAVDLSLGVALASGVVILPLLLSVLKKKKDESLSNNIHNIKQCVYCGYIFFQYKQMDIYGCPCCKSYLSSKQEQIL